MKYKHVFAMIHCDLYGIWYMEAGFFIDNYERINGEIFQIALELKKKVSMTDE